MVLSGENAKENVFYTPEDFISKFGKKTWDNKIVPQFVKIARETMKSALEHLQCPAVKQKCFKILGYDILVDKDFKCYLAEINARNVSYKYPNQEFRESFYKNILKAGFKEKVTAIKGDSAFVLIDLIKQNKRYDFIYVDGSHKAIDCFTDCFLSWQLLNINGIMGIDDYLYKISFTNEFENVQKGVDHFLQKIKGQYILLVNGYRRFIQKI